MSRPADSRTVYLDHAATTPVDPDVVQAMAPFWHEVYGNPSSLHTCGRAARTALDTARATVAGCLGADPAEIVFTSGGTEANNLVLFGVTEALREKGRHMVTSAIEHSAVLNPCRRLESQGWEVTYLPVDSEGRLHPDTLRAALRPDTVLASMMHGNNEVGTLQDLHALGAVLREREIPFHTDAVQTVGKLPMDLTTLPVDYLTFSGHKLYGPKGVGGLFIRKGCPLPVPGVLGGGQEGGLRSGTENLPAIVGLARALALAVERMPEETARLRALQDFFITTVEELLENTGHIAVLNGPRNVAERVPGNVHFSFPPVEGEALVLHLDLAGIAVSSGSACHGKSLAPSHVVLALEKPSGLAKSTVRFSLGRTTTREDLTYTADRLESILNRLVRQASAGTR